MSLKIDEVAVGKLVPNPWNTNEMTAENEQKLENSLRRRGFTKPIIVRTLADGSLQILGGEHRWRAADRLGFETVPVVNLGAIDDQAAKEIGLVDNGRYGEDDTFKLAELLKGMGEPGELLAILPMSGAELDDLFSAASIGLEELGLPTGDEEALPDLATPKAPQTHVLMRFKVPTEDAAYIERVVESAMKAQGFTHEDSLSNAGNALVYLIRSK